MIKLVIFLICCVVSFIMFMDCLINGVRWAINVFAHRECVSIVCAFRKSGFVLFGVLLFMGLFVITTQLLVFTPTIKDSNGKVVKGSMASIECVKLNGHKEWITIRGYDKEAPLLLQAGISREVGNPTIV